MGADAAARTRVALAAVRLAAWANACLGGSVSAERAAAGVAVGRAGPVAGVAPEHLVEGLPGSDGAAGLVTAFAHLANMGATGAGAVLPAPGDAYGLAGPPVLNERAITAGHAVFILGAALRSGDPESSALALIAAPSPASVTVWRAYPARTPPPPDAPSSAARQFREALLAAANDITTLDDDPIDRAADARTAAEAATAAIRTGRIPGPSNDVVFEQASRVWITAQLALAGACNHVSTSAAAVRRDRLHALEQAARRALAALSAANHPAHTGDHNS